MKKPFGFLVLLAGIISMLVSGVIFNTASAHQTITVGNYEVEIGWVNEPPIVGQRNAIVVNISVAGATSAPASEDTKPTPIDISGLKVDVVYGSETKSLTLQPLSEDSTDQYIAPILPTIPGKYTIKLSGTLGEGAASGEVQPEEVEAADSLQFPKVATMEMQQSSGPSLSTWLAGAALLIGLVALGVSGASLLKPKK